MDSGGTTICGGERERERGREGGEASQQAQHGPDTVTRRRRVLVDQGRG